MSDLDGGYGNMGVVILISELSKVWGIFLILDGGIRGFGV